MDTVPLFIIPITLAILAQTIKGSINFVNGNRNFKTFIMNGGFPSSHSAFVSSLVTLIAIYDGMESTTFTVALVLASIIIHDAIRVRVHIGRIGKSVNAILRTLKGEERFKNLRTVKENVEITGHNPLEVFAGSLIGIIGTMLFVLLWY